MGVLCKAELARRIEVGELIVNARTLPGGAFDLQGASYDMMAGTIVWKDDNGQVQVKRFNPKLAFNAQDHVTLHPGQMLSIITHEELKLPKTLCAYVFSKNNLALNGIFAFNAGHVDPGYSGPIIIRLISLRSTPFTITLGKPIYTVVFENLDVSPQDEEHLEGKGPLTMDAAMEKVRQFSDVALSNALFQLYEDKLQERLSEAKTAALAAIRSDVDRDFVRKESLKTTLYLSILAAIGSIIAIAGTIAALVANLGKITGKLK